MSDTVALTGIIVLGVVAVVAIVFGVPLRSKANRAGFELSVEPTQPPEPDSTNEK